MDPIFNVTLSGPHVSLDEHTSRHVDNGSIILHDVELDLGTFNCGLGTQKGFLSLHEGDQGNGFAFLAFQFITVAGGAEVTVPAGISHSLGMHVIITDPADWLPAESNSMSEGPEVGNGQWRIRSNGRNHANGCKSEGTDLDFLAVIVRQ